MITYKLLAACLLVGAIGCAHAPLDPASPQTYHLHLPGIAGNNFVHSWWCHELDDAVPGMHSELYDWTGHRFMIDVLQAYERNHEQGKIIAKKIEQEHRDHPDVRVVLSAESGGAGPLVWALEDLPADVQVDSVILLSPALSPEYDLSRALHHVRTTMHVFTSQRDNLFLGWGTEKYGTIDGKREQAAGRFGFVAPPSADSLQYAKIVNVPYRESWWKYFNFGGHAQAISPAFGKNVIAPLIADGNVRG